MIFDNMIIYDGNKGAESNMKGIVRKIDKLGRIVLPQEFRASLKVGIGSDICIELNNGSMTLTPTQSICGVCGSVITTVRKLRLCDRCISAVKHEAE